LSDSIARQRLGNAAAFSLQAVLYTSLAACIARLWLMPLGSSFWLDEALTAFVVHHGESHPSLAVAPQVVASVYYYLPRAAEALFGFSEIAYRLPSVLAMGLALFFISRLAARLIDPAAGWFAALACFALGGINYQAADARPYGLGTCVAAATVLSLVRWLDSGRGRDALIFVLCGALLWRVHLIYWPLYLVIALYAGVRLARGETQVGWLKAAGIFALLAAALIPVVVDAVSVLRQASAHAYAPLPDVRELFNSVKLGLVLAGTVGAWLLARYSRSLEAEGLVNSPGPAISSWILILGWWLLHPLCLFIYSRLSGNSVFLSRYLSVALPGGVLAAAGAASLWMPPARWKHAALALGAGSLLLMGQWRAAWPRHDPSDWRGAARQLSRLALAADTPVLCPSPFLEARPPVWRPDYPLPGFLYAHLDTYPIPGRPILLPFEPSPEALEYAASLAKGTLPAAGRFAIYGGDSNVRFWSRWFAARPAIAGWRQTRFDSFGNVWVVVFERGTRQPGGEQAK
jgi:mannosyltransferase